MNYIEIFTDALKNKKNEIQINGDDFLICAQLNSYLTYKLNYLNDVVNISAKFESEFEDTRAAEMLRYRCILNKTFDEMSLDFVSDLEIGVESLEFGNFNISGKTDVDISISNNDYSEAVKYMMFFMQIIAIADNIANA